MVFVYVYIKFIIIMTGRRKTNEMEGESPSIIKVTWVTNTIHHTICLSLLR